MKNTFFAPSFRFTMHHTLSKDISLSYNLGAEMNVKLIDSKSIDVSVMPNSVYFIEVKTNNGIIRKKFVKE